MDEISSILELSKDKLANSKLDKIIQQPFEYICKTPGQQIALKLFHALDHWFDIPPLKFNLIIDMMKMLRNASLLVDDIQDKTTTRRGLPVAHLIYGVASTVNAATYAYSILLKKILLLDHPQAMQVFIEEMMVMLRGQGIDIYWRDNYKPPTYLEYKLMAVQKLGSLFKLGARLMQLFSTKTIDVSRLIVIIGIYAQIWDDYHSLSEDITEGKFGFPMIHALLNDNSGLVLDILKQNTADAQAIKDCISRMETLGSLQYTLESLKSLDKLVREEMAKFGPNPLMDDLLNELQSPKA